MFFCSAPLLTIYLLTASGCLSGAHVKDPVFTRARKTPVGAYLWRVSNIVSDIDQNIADIKLAQSLLLSFAPEFSLLQKDQNDAQLIRYHYENFFLRATKLRDLSLRLINDVMQT